MSTSPASTSPAADDAQRLKEAQLKIGMALKNAQYALTTHAHRGLAAALHENVNALTALSTYLSLSGSPVKAAAIAGQMAKILKSVVTYVSARERNTGSSHHGADNSRHSSSPTTPTGSVVLPDETGFPSGTPREASPQVAELQRALEELTKQRDNLMEEKQALEAQLEEARLATVSSSAASVTARSDAAGSTDNTEAMLRKLRAEVDALKREVRAEHMKAAALTDQLHEAEEQIEDKVDQVHALKSQLRISQEEKLSQDAAFSKKEEEIKALQESLLQNTRQASATAAAESRVTAPHGYVDKDDFDALKLQNQLLQQALREQATKARPTDTQSAITQESLEEIEADHQQQLEAMKLTIQEQFNRETELLEKQRGMQDTIDDLQRQLQLSSNRQWVQQEREKHLNEMDTAKAQMEALQDTIEKQEKEMHQQKERIDELEDAEKSVAEANKNLKVHYETQLSELRTELQNAKDQIEALTAQNDALREQLDNERQQHETYREQTQRSDQAKLSELRQQLAAEQEHCTAMEATAAKRDAEVQQQIAQLQETVESERRAHEGQVAALQQEHDDKLSQLQKSHVSQLAQLTQEVEVARAQAADVHGSATERDATAQEQIARLQEMAAVEEQTHKAQMQELENTHAGEVGKLREQLAAESELAKAAAATAAERDTTAQHNAEQLQAALQEESAKYKAQLEDVEHMLEAERAHAAAAEQNAAARDAALAQLREQIAAATEQHEAHLAQTQQLHDAQLSQLQEHHEAEVAQLKQQLNAEKERASGADQRCAQVQTTLAAERDQHAVELSKLKQDHVTQLAEVEEKLESEREHAVAAKNEASESDAVAQQHIEQLQHALNAAQEQHSAEVLQLQERHAEELAQVHRAADEEQQHQDTQVAELKKNHESKVAKLAQQLEEERERANYAEGSATERDAGAQQRMDQLQSTIDAERENHTAELDEVKQSHETEVAQLREEIAAQEEKQKSQLAALQSRHDVNIKELEEQLTAERERVTAAEASATDGNTAAQQQIAQLQETVKSERQQHEAQVAELKHKYETQLTNLQEQLHEEQAVASAAERKAVEHDNVTRQQLQQLEAKVAAEIAELNASLTAERTQHADRVAQLQKDHEYQLKKLAQQLEEERERANYAEGSATERDAGAQQRMDQLQSTIDAERENHAAAIAELQQKHTAALSEMDQSYKAQIAELQEVGEAERQRATALEGSAKEQESEVLRCVRELQDTLNSERDEHEVQLTEWREKLAAEHARVAAVEANVAERDAAAQQLQRSITTEREEHEGIVSELRRNHDKALAVLKQTHGTEMAELQKQLNAARGRVAEVESEASERGADLQKKLTELQDSAATDRGLLQGEVAELRQKLEVQSSRADAAEAAMKTKAKEAAQAMKVAAEARAAEADAMRAEHEVAIKRMQEDTALQVKRVRREMADKVTVAAQPVDWLKDENEALRKQCQEWEEKCRTATKEKTAAVQKAREAEQTLTSRKAEVKRLREECNAMQDSMTKSLEEKEAAMTQLASNAQAAEDARDTAARLTALRGEMQELQQQLETAEKDKGLLVARYKRATAEKEECAEATRKLLTQYKETAAALEKLRAQNTAAAAVEKEGAERANRPRDLPAEVESSFNGSAEPSSKNGAVNKDQVKKIEDMEKLVDALVTQLDAVKRDNAQLQRDLATAREAAVAPKAASPPSPKDAPDTLTSLADMRQVLSKMHAQALPALNRVYQRVQTAAAADVVSMSQLDAMRELYAAMEEAHAETQATLADFDGAAQRLRVSAELQGVLYGKLLSSLRSTEASSTSPVMDVALLCACTALFTEVCAGPVEEANGSHVANHEPSLRITSQPTRAESCSDRPSQRSQQASLRSPPAVPASTATVDGARRVIPLHQRDDERGDGPSVSSVVTPAGERRRSGRYAVRGSPQRGASFDNFAAAQANISAAEQRASLRPAPTPSWR